ncbi:Asparaginase [alpha proteobacterium BAL199]|jgi:L-asparaginase|nr:Asparaginase [alpha proteobacterium BAL199]
MTDKPRIAVLALGGTIAMVKGDHGGVRPGLGADDLVAAVPGIDRFATISAETVKTVGSSDLTVDDVLAVASRITELVDAGAIDGAVVTQGTDTMEESSFLLDLALDGRIPVVVTGAMRNPLSVSHDGPGNLLAAVMTVADLEVRRRSAKLGVLVVLLDTIHAAIDVAKASPHRIDAFHSMVAGPVGVLVEDRVRLLGTPNRAHKKAFDTATGNRRPAGWTDTNASVALLTLGLGESGGLLAALADDPAHFGYSGAVLGAMGGGHTPSWVVEHVEALARRMPVVMAARIQSGYLLEATYERAGSEIDLIKRGVVSAGRLPPLKARLLLTMLLRAEATREASQAVWDTLN